ncbi:MAG: DNA repair protein RecO [Bacteroidales bacterium]|nr:DNA repair protein RecO [Bacteroidales bacterium]
MLVSTKGIVLHRMRYSDSSIIVKIFTENYGVLSFIIKNAFSQKSKITHAFFAPMSLIQLTFIHKNSPSLLYVKEVSFRYHYVDTPFNPIKSSLLLFYNELIYRLLQNYGADERIFSFIEQECISLDQCENLRPDIHLFFMLKLATELGFCPDNNYSATKSYFSVEESCFSSFPQPEGEGLDAEASQYFSSLLNSIHGVNASLQNAPQNFPVANKFLRNKVIDILIHFFELHNEQIKEIRSVAVFREIMN